MNEIRVYGADWCGDTQITRYHLDNLGVEYQYFDVDGDPNAAQWVKNHNDGKQKTPTVDIAGQVLTEPDERQLDQVLRGKGLMS